MRIFDKLSESRCNVNMIMLFPLFYGRDLLLMRRRASWYINIRSSSDTSVINHRLHDIFSFISPEFPGAVSRCKQAIQSMNEAHTIGLTIMREAKLRGGDVALKYSQAVRARARALCSVHVPRPHCLLHPGCVVCWKSSSPWIRVLPATIVLSYLSCARTKRCILPTRPSSLRSFSSQIIRLKFQRRCLLEYFAVKEYSKILIIRQTLCSKNIID